MACLLNITQAISCRRPEYACAAEIPLSWNVFGATRSPKEKRNGHLGWFLCWDGIPLGPQAQDNEFRGRFSVQQLHCPSSPQAMDGRVVEQRDPVVGRLLANILETVPNFEFPSN